jgi:hypothetical protein
MASAVPRRVVLLTALALPGCSASEPAVTPSTSGSGPTPAGSNADEAPTTAEAFRATRTFALAAESGRARGTLRREGRPVEVEVAGDAAGTDQHVVVEGKGAGLAEVLSVDDRHWLAGDLDFWRSRGLRGARARAATSGWLAVTLAQARRVAPWTLRTLLTDRFARADLLALESATVAVTRREVDGRRLWVLGGTEGPRLWVAADGSAELVRMVVPDGTDLDFTDWGRVEPFEAPDPGTVRRS